MPERAEADAPTALIGELMALAASIMALREDPRTHLMLRSNAGWVEVPAGPKDQEFDQYPQESLAAWHQRLGLEDPEV